MRLQYLRATETPSPPLRGVGIAVSWQCFVFEVNVVCDLRHCAQTEAALTQAYPLSAADSFLPWFLFSCGWKTFLNCPVWLQCSTIYMQHWHGWSVVCEHHSLFCRQLGSTICRYSNRTFCNGAVPRQCGIGGGRRRGWGVHSWPVAILQDVCSQQLFAYFSVHHSAAWPWTAVLHLMPITWSLLN